MWPMEIWARQRKSNGHKNIDINNYFSAIGRKPKQVMFTIFNAGQYSEDDRVEE